MSVSSDHGFLDNTSGAHSDIIGEGHASVHWMSPTMKKKKEEEACSV